MSLEHCCGAQGFSVMLGDSCQACDLLHTSFTKDFNKLRDYIAQYYPKEVNSVYSGMVEAYDKEAHLDIAAGLSSEKVFQNGFMRAVKYLRELEK